MCMYVDKLWLTRWLSVLTLIPRIHRVEGEGQLQQVAL